MPAVSMKLAAVALAGAAARASALAVAPDASAEAAAVRNFMEAAKGPASTGPRPRQLALSSSALEAATASANAANQYRDLDAELLGKADRIQQEMRALTDKPKKSLLAAKSTRTVVDDQRSRAARFFAANGLLKVGKLLGSDMAAKPRDHIGTAAAKAFLPDAKTKAATPVAAVAHAKAVAQQAKAKVAAPAVANAKAAAPAVANAKAAAPAVAKPEVAAPAVAKAEVAAPAVAKAKVAAPVAKAKVAAPAAKAEVAAPAAKAKVAAPAAKADVAAPVAKAKAESKAVGRILAKADRIVETKAFVYSHRALRQQIYGAH